MPEFNDSFQLQAAGLLALRLSSRALALYYELLREHGHPAALLAEPELCRASGELFQAFRSREGLISAVDQLKSWHKEGISAVGLGDPLYPERLTRIYQPPPILFYRGELRSAVNEMPAAAVVGSRRADAFGCDIARQFGRGLAGRGACVVSGLALGVDGAAHGGALEAGAALPTIAVLGNGLGTIYPSAHGTLARRILDSGGLLLSQFEPDEKPYPSNFLNRNRVIAGLSDGVIVIQAAARSGALVTARYALEEGREVMAVPGNIADDHYTGSNRLLKQGAHLIASLEDAAEILPGLNPEAPPGEKCAPGAAADSDLSAGKTAIVAALRGVKSLQLDLLSEQLKAPPDLARDLLELELDEVITRLPGNQIALRARV